VILSTEVIGVHIWGKRVGAVARDPRLDAYVFEYDPAWVRGKIELAPFQMPLSPRTRVFSFPGLPKETFRRLPGLLGDALPDDFGNALVTAYLESRGVPKDSITTLDRLAYMGRRGMGALEFLPPIESAEDSQVPLEMSSMVEAARRVLSGNFAGDVQAQAALANIIQVGTSAGGARAKAVIAWNPVSQEIRSGQFDVDPGFEHWLLKFDGIGKDLELGTGADYGRIEYAYHLMATAAGIAMSPCRLLEENGRAHFMTKRFDRDGNGRHHLSSLCAMAHLDYKQRATHAYEQLFQVVDRLDFADRDLAMAQTFLRMAFNVVGRNCDDHTKNFAFLLKEGGPWEISPAYDVTHAHNPNGEWTAQHLMSVNGRFDAIREEDLLTVADRFSVPAARSLLKNVRAAVGSWGEFATKAGVSKTEATRVSDDFQMLEPQA
jgi:serine/threonine-protein kinase HipA